MHNYGGYFNLLYPNALTVVFPGTSLSVFSKGPYVYEIENNRLNFYESGSIRPKGNGGAGGATPTTTKRNIEEVDSLYRLITTGQIEFRLEGNRLFLSRKDVQFMALFMAD